jgi:DNA-binding MarR family transcriptional regulator
MTDIISDSQSLGVREADLRQGIELLFFAYRDFTAEPDSLLARHGFGRAHHRAIYFIGRHPGITVSELLSILNITKQSLSRVLGRLIEEGFVIQSPGPQDRRQRLLTLTIKGLDLERQLTELQMRRLAGAFRSAGPAAVRDFREVMMRIMDEEGRKRFAPTKVKK